MDIMLSLKSLINSKAFKVLVFIILPFAYGMSLSHVQKLDSEINGSQLSSTNESSLDFKSVQGEVSAPDSVNSIFPLAKYFSIWPLVSFNNPKICFQDRGSYVSYTNGTVIPASLEWTIDYNGKNITLEQDSEACQPAEFGHNFTYKWYGKLYFLVQKNESLGNVKVVPQTITYHTFDYDYGLLQAISLIPALYLLFWYPVIGIVKKVEKGWKEQ